MKTNRSTLDSLDFIRNFDSAPASVIDRTATIRSEARLEQLHAISSPLVEERHRRVSKPRVLTEASRGFEPVRKRLSARQLALRLTAIPVAAAALIAGTTLAQPGNPVGPAQAFASWTPEAIPVSQALLDPANSACLSQINARGTYTHDGQPFLTHPVSGYPTLSEQRGDWFILGYTGDEIVFAYCLFQVVDGAPILQNGIVRGEPNWMITLWNPIVNDQVDTFGSSFMGGMPLSLIADNSIPDEGTMTVFAARVDPDVTAVDITLGSGNTVNATVADGTVFAWWPADKAGNSVESVLNIAMGTDEAGESSPGWDAHSSEWLHGNFAPLISGFTVTNSDGETFTSSTWAGSAEDVANAEENRRLWGELPGANNVAPETATQDADETD